MKKILLFIAISITTLFSSNAQSTSNIHYQGEFTLDHSFGIGTFSTNRVNIHTIHGVKIGNNFFIGAGLGLDYYYEMYEKGELMMPIFMNIKGYLPLSSKVSPFLSLKLGYGVGLTNGIDNADGLMWSPTLGIKIRSFQAYLGYTSQRISERGIGIDMNALTLGIGVVF